MPYEDHGQPEKRRRVDHPAEAASAASADAASLPPISDSEFSARLARYTSEMPGGKLKLKQSEYGSLLGDLRDIGGVEGLSSEQRERLVVLVCETPLPELLDDPFTDPGTTDILTFHRDQFELLAHLGDCLSPEFKRQVCEYWLIHSFAFVALKIRVGALQGLFDRLRVLAESTHWYRIIKASLDQRDLIVRQVLDEIPERVKREASVNHHFWKPDPRLSSFAPEIRREIAADICGLLGLFEFLLGTPSAELPFNRNMQQLAEHGVLDDLVKGNMALAAIRQGANPVELFSETSGERWHNLQILLNSQLSKVASVARLPDGEDVRRYKLQLTRAFVEIMAWTPWFTERQRATVISALVDRLASYENGEVDDADRCFEPRSLYEDFGGKSICEYLEQLSQQWPESRGLMIKTLLTSLHKLSDSVCDELIENNDRQRAWFRKHVAHVEALHKVLWQQSGSTAGRTAFARQLVGETLTRDEQEAIQKAVLFGVEHAFDLVRLVDQARDLLSVAVMLFPALKQTLLQCCEEKDGHPFVPKSWRDPFYSCDYKEVSDLMAELCEFPAPEAAAAAAVPGALGVGGFFAGAAAAPVDYEFDEDLAGGMSQDPAA